MSKSSIRDIPSELKSFYQAFQLLTDRHEIAVVFDDYLSMMINYFTPPNEQGCGTECFKKYSYEERKVFSDLLTITLKTYSEQIEVQEWYDFFGEFYQFLTSRFKQSHLGQFFTPVYIVDLMVKMQGTSKELTGKGARINDPTCGSGRMLIAYHAHYPGNYTFGEDLDPICCKMTCINMMMHGCEGQVVQHDSLDPEDYQRGWAINSRIREIGLPSIRDLPKEKSYVWQMWQRQKAEAEVQKNPFKKRQTANQLSLFPQ